MRTAVILLVLTSSAFAADLTVNDQDQQNIAAICNIAKMSPLVESRQAVVQIAEFCVRWNGMVQAAKAKDEPKPDEESKP